jgi:hypothetical protein
MNSACTYCGATPRTELVGNQHFIICRGNGNSGREGCAGPQGDGFRPLTNGRNTALEAEAAWRELVSKRSLSL